MTADYNGFTDMPEDERESQVERPAITLSGAQHITQSRILVAQSRKRLDV